MQGGRNEPAVQCGGGEVTPPYDAAESEVKYNGERAEQADADPRALCRGTGSVPVALDRDAFARMGYRERLALKKENPEVYKELRK